MNEYPRTDSMQSKSHLEDGISPRALWAVLRRRRTVFLATTAVAAAVAVAVAWLVPTRYRAEAVVSSEPMLAGDGLRVDGAEVGQQLARIQEVLHRRSHLERVAAELSLFPGAKDGDLEDRQVEDLQSRIRVRAAGPQSYSISFEGEDREQVAQAASRLAELLIVSTQSERETRAGARSSFLQEQVAAATAEVERIEGRIEEYRESWSAEIPQQVGANQKALETARDREQALETRITTDQSRLAALRDEAARLEDQGVTLEPRNALGAELAESRRELDRLRARYTDRHPEVQRAAAEVERLERAAAENPVAVASPDYSPVQLRYLEVGSEIRALEERLAATRSERAAVAGETAELERRIGAAPRHEAELEGLTRERAAARERYDDLVAQLDEARLVERLQSTREGSLFHLVEAPRVPKASAGPRRLRVLVMGLLAALGLGIAAVFLAEQADTSFRDAAELQAATHLPVLATVPTVRPPRGRGEVSSPGDPTPLGALQGGVPGEQFRILATRLLHRKGSMPSMTVLVTSAVGGEGKTTCAVNLASTLARIAEGEVLLVDGDLCRPSIHVHGVVQASGGQGLQSLLADPTLDPDDPISRQEGLAVLEAGPATAETRALLASPRTQRVFQRLKKRFPWIVIDVSPILTVADGLILQKVADAVVLVVRAESTSRSLVQRAVGEIDAGRLAGVVLNGVDPGELRSYAYPDRYAEALGATAEASLR